MAYYTERHGMRKPVAKTYDISIEKYALLLHCCEKYYNDYRIRHHETDKVEITDVRYYDYFFNRCLSLIALAIQYLQ